MRIASLKRKTIPKVAVLVMGLTAAVLVATINPAPAQAFPNKQQDCTNCHGVGTPAGTVNAVPSTTTPAAGATYTVLVTEPLNTDEPAGDTGYWIANSTAAGATGLTTGVYGGYDGTGAATRTATMTAPAAAGTYYYKVWAVKGSTAPTGVTNFKVYSITVAGAPVVVTTTTALAVTPASPVVAPGSPTLKATVSGAGAAGTVEFFNGTTSLGTPSAISAGVASKTLTGVVAGSYSYKAVFTPTDATAFTSSTSAVSTYVVTAPVPAPTASFTASAIAGIAPLAVTLTDTSTGAPTSWLWTFGNGSTSNVQNPPAVTYTTAGTYDVTLIVSNANGASAPVTKTITVTDPAVTTPISSFTASAISGIAPVTVAMTDTSTGAPTSWAWDFGNGATSSLQNPSVDYAAAGVYTVTLTASNADGTGTVDSQIITVTDAPVITALISGLSPQHGLVGDTVTINGSGFGTAGVVLFDGVAVTTSNWTDASITFVVPAGSRSALVSVTPTDDTASNLVKFRFEHVKVPRI